MIMMILCLELIVSFNRYMVECEYAYSRNKVVAFMVLIDTWWNVNSVRHTIRQAP